MCHSPSLWNALSLCGILARRMNEQNTVQRIVGKQERTKQIADGGIVVDSRRVGRQLNGNGRRIVAFSCCWLAGWMAAASRRHGATSSAATTAEPAANVGVVSPGTKTNQRTNERKKKRTCFTTFYFSPPGATLSR